MHYRTMLKRAKRYEDTEIFTMIVDKVVTTIGMGLLKHDPYLLSLEPYITPVDPDIAKNFPQTRGIEHPRMMKILYHRGAFDPIIYLMRGGKHWLADGNHRYYVAYLQNRKELPAIIVPEHIWSPYILTGMEDFGMGQDLTPEELQKSWSGITW